MTAYGTSLLSLCFVQIMTVSLSVFRLRHQCLKMRPRRLSSFPILRQYIYLFMMFVYYVCTTLTILKLSIAVVYKTPCCYVYGIRMYLVHGIWYLLQYTSSRCVWEATPQVFLSYFRIRMHGLLYLCLDKYV